MLCFMATPMRLMNVGFQYSVPSLWLDSSSSCSSNSVEPSPGRLKKSVLSQPAMRSCSRVRSSEASVK